MSLCQGASYRSIDMDVLKNVVEKANNSDHWYSREDISKLYAKEMGYTKVTKRKPTPHAKPVTYSLLGTSSVKDAGGLLSKEKKIERVFNDIIIYSCSAWIRRLYIRFCCHYFLSEVFKQLS